MPAVVVVAVVVAVAVHSASFVPSFDEHTSVGPKCQRADRLGLAAVVVVIIVAVAAAWREGSTAVRQLGLVSKVDLR